MKTRNHPPSGRPQQHKERQQEPNEVPACKDKENLNDKQQRAQAYRSFEITPIFTGGIISNLSRM